MNMIVIMFSFLMFSWSLFGEESALNNFDFNTTHNENNYGFAPAYDDIYDANKIAKIAHYFRAKQQDDFDVSDDIPLIEEENPLCNAVINRNKKMVEKLLREKKQKVNAKNKDGVTALHFAAAGNDAEIAKLLLHHGANPNSMNNDGDTPLHIAAKESAFSVAQELLAYGAHTNIENNENKKPIDCATNNRMRSIISHKNLQQYYTQHIARTISQRSASHQRQQ